WYVFACQTLVFLKFRQRFLNDVFYVQGFELFPTNTILAEKFDKFEVFSGALNIKSKPFMFKTPEKTSDVSLTYRCLVLVSNAIVVEAKDPTSLFSMSESREDP